MRILSDDEAFLEHPCKSSRLPIARRCCPAAVAVGLLVLLSSIATAKPLSKTDIEGKKICWGQNYATFSAGGKASSNVAGDGVWSISKSGVITVKFPGGPYSGVVRETGDGAFEYSGSWVGTPKLTVVGVLCN